MTDDIWGLREILNADEYYILRGLKWWQLPTRFRRWNDRRKARIARERWLFEVMAHRQCDYTEAVRYAQEITQLLSDRMDDTMHDMNCRLLYGNDKESDD